MLEKDVNVGVYYIIPPRLLSFRVTTPPQARFQGLWRGGEAPTKCNYGPPSAYICGPLPVVGSVTMYLAGVKLPCTWQGGGIKDHSLTTNLEISREASVAESL